MAHVQGGFSAAPTQPYVQGAAHSGPPGEEHHFYAHILRKNKVMVCLQYQIQYGDKVRRSGESPWSLTIWRVLVTY